MDLAAFGAHARLVECSACNFRWSQAPEESPESDNPEGPVASSPVSGDNDSRTSSQSLSENEGQTAADPQLGSGLVESEASPAETAVPEVDKDEVAGTVDEINAPPLAHEKEAAQGEESAGDAAKAEPVVPDCRRPGTVFVAATAAAATLLALAALLILLRGSVVSLLPEAAGVYGFIGLAPDSLGEGLEIREVASARERVDGQEVMTVTGVVANIAGSRESLPPLRITLYDSADEELQFVTVRHPQPSLDAGQAIRFQTKISSPNLEARQLRVGFAPEP